MSLIFSVLTGAGVGMVLGHFGKCSSGSCPLTATWWKGGLYGALLGFMFHTVSPGTGASSPESARNVKLIQEQQFQAEVSRAAGPVVVDFFATWCGPCKALSPILDSLAEPLTNQVKFVKVDVDRAAKLAERFEVEGVPTLIFFKDGQVVDKMVGLPTRDALQQRLESLVSSRPAPGTKSANSTTQSK